MHFINSAARAPKECCILLVLLFISQTDGAVTLPSPTQLFQQGSTYTINCQITGGETFVAWETPGIPSETITLDTKGRREVVQTGDNYGLKITNVIASDGGVYRCIGSLESKEFTANVNININIQNQHQTLHLGRKETLVFGVSAYPALTYTWTKDGQPVSFDARRTLDGRTGSITFSPVQLPDQGNYTCNVNNAFTSHQYDPIRVQVIDSPVINKYQGDPVKRRLTQGYNATFYCKIKSGAPKPTIGFWYGWTNKNKKVDEIYTPRYSHPTPEEWTITGITTEDKGKFRCIAENVAGQDDLKIEITEVDIPPKIDPPLTDVVVNEGVDRALDCKVTGLPAPTVEWFDQNGVRVPDQWNATEGPKIVQKIRFRNVQWQNSGKYTCRARNGALDGDEKIIVEEQTISLNVNSPPKLLPSPNPVYSFMGNWKPTIILCKFSGFPAPLVKMVNENGTEVASGNGSASFTIPVTDSEDVFGNYNCSAVNTFGSDGVLLELKVAVIPGPPRQVFANTTCKDVTLKWDYPESDGGMVITNYVIRVLNDSMRTVHQETVAGNLREADINYNDFKAETKYGVELMARNDVGYGKKETISATTKKYCVPGKPTITNTGDEVDSTFILTWLKPNYDGLDSIIKYKVEWRKKPITDASVFFDEKNIDATQLTVNNLEGGAEYEFKVFAENRAGFSEPDTMTFRVRKGSEAFSWTQEPDKPTIVIEDGVNNKNVRLVWNFLLDAVEDLLTVVIEREDLDGGNRVQIASRLKNTGYTLNTDFYKHYSAELPSQLLIFNVNNVKEYKYILIIRFSRSGAARSATSTVDVKVFVPPRITIPPASTSRVDAGQNLTLMCNASGDPRPNITWTREGATQANQLVNATGYRLYLVNVQKGHVGLYRCTASNGYGTVSSLALVNVRCPSNQCDLFTVGITILGMEFKDAFRNKASVEYQQLASNVTSAIANVYTKFPQKELYELAIEEFRNGSTGVVAIVQLLFGDPLQPLQNGITDGKLGPLTVVNQLDINLSTTMRPATPSGDPAGATPNTQTNSSPSDTGMAVTMGGCIALILATVM